MLKVTVFPNVGADTPDIPTEARVVLRIGQWLEEYADIEYCWLDENTDMREGDLLVIHPPSVLLNDFFGRSFNSIWAYSTVLDAAKKAILTNICAH